MAHAVGSVTAQRCPRCSAPVVGDFKFCPACAYRLKPGAVGPTPTPPVRGTQWSAGFVIAAGAVVLLATALGIVLVVRPQWLRPMPAPAEVVAPPDVDIEKPVRVDEIRFLLKEMQPGWAMWYPIPDPETGETRSLAAWVPWFQMMKYEVTCGMYGEYLEDLEANPHRVPDRLRKAAAAAKDDFDLFDHVPPPWLLRDLDGKPNGWRLEPAQTNLPVTNVTLNDALAFAEWAGERVGTRLQLPYVFEWVRAARGGKIEPLWLWPWGTAKLQYACNHVGFWPEGKGRLLPVGYWYPQPPGTMGTTADGLWSMSGNAAEMVLGHGYEILVDPTEGRPHVRLKPFPPGAPVQQLHAYGGSFKSGIDDCRCESNVPVWYWERREDLGFRLVARPE